MITAVKSASNNGPSGSIGNFSQLYRSVCGQLDLAIKGFTAVKLIFFKIPQIPIPLQYEKTFLLIDVLKLVKLPILLEKFRRSTSIPEVLKHAASIYFCLFDVRKALRWIPAYEFPFAAVIGLGTIELFRHSLKNYLACSDTVEIEDTEISSNGSIGRYVRDVASARFEALDATFIMVNSLATGAQVFFPRYKLVCEGVANTSKLAGLILPLVVKSSSS